MKRALLFVGLGMFFGIVLIKSEVSSWFRIEEMFHFQALHMYGIMGLAVAIGALSVQAVKSFGLRALDGSAIDLTPKPTQWRANLLGGIVFGLGWALCGSCPGPIWALVGAGYLPMLVVLASALCGTWSYGLVREKLPH